MSNDFLIRPAGSGDIDSLKNIWQICFGDNISETELFFDTFFNESSAVLLSCEDKIAAAAHILFISELVDENAAIPCPYIYGVGVLPGFRGSGFGIEISIAAVKRCSEMGFKTCCIVPANDGLFDFYSSKAGFHDYFTVNEQKFCHNDDFKENCIIKAVPGSEYNILREQALGSTAHIRFNETACKYLDCLLASSGGGLFKLSYNNIHAAAAIALEDNSIQVKELLCKQEDAELLAQNIMIYFNKQECLVKMPGTGKRFGMLNNSLTGNAYFGFAFD